MQFNWTAEHSQALREHLARGLSYSRSVAAINAEFKTDYTRNAALGRAKRMGIGASEQPNASPKHLPAKQQPPKPKIPHLGRPREQHVPDFIWPIPVFVRAEMPKLRCVEVEPRHLSIVDLEPGDCRYPYGGDSDGESVTFCGHPRREGSSYCAPHFHLTRGLGVVCRRPTGSVTLRLVGGGMKRDPKPNLASTVRMKPLSHHHRIAHLLALIREEPAQSIRREQLTVLLHNEIAAPVRHGAGVGADRFRALE